jgi:hypothetical protein
LGPRAARRAFTIEASTARRSRSNSRLPRCATLGLISSTRKEAT